MKVFYYQAEGGNVGDDLNAVLWRHLLPDLDHLDTADWLIGVGTIIDERLNALEGPKVVVGSGLRAGRQLPRFSDDLRFAAVRGKLTAERLGLGPDVALGDAGFLVGSLLDPLVPLETARPDKVALIPHVYTERWSKVVDVARDAGLSVISPTLSVREFLERLAGCSRVYCESLHAAIFADALRIPWTRVRISSHYYEGDGVSEFKWRDAFSITDVPTQSAIREVLIPIRRRVMRPLQGIAERRVVKALVARRDDAAVFRLSDAGRLQERTSILLSRVMQLRSPQAMSGWPNGSSLQARSVSTRVAMFPKHVDNPYIRRLAAKLERAGATVDEFSYPRALTHRYDVLHLHWPDSHLISGSWWGSLAKHARFAALLTLLRLRGTRIIWTLHNLKPHDANHWISARLFPSWFPRVCTHVIALTANGLQSARTLYPALKDTPAAVVPHGHYRDDYPRAPLQRECRERLGLPLQRFTFLFFGNVRRYKNVPLLIEAFRAIGDRDVQLIIAGQPGHGISAEELQTLSAGDDRISLDLKFIPDQDVPVYFGAADAVVLPFDSILNSGSVLLGLSFNRVVLAPRLGALPEIQARVGPWLQLYDGGLTTKMLLDLRAAHAGPASEEAGPDLSAFDWNSIADRTLEFYRQRSDAAAEDSVSTAATEQGRVYETPRNEYSKT